MFRRNSVPVAEAALPAVHVDVPQAPSEKQPVAAPVRDARWLGVRVSVHAQLLELLGPTLYDARLSQEELAARVSASLSAILRSMSLNLTPEQTETLTREITDDILGYGPLEPYLRDPEITEIMVTGHEMFHVERRGLLQEVPASFLDEAHLRRVIEKIAASVGRRIDEASPMVDARLPDGSRVNAVIPPIALNGSTLAIRKFSATPLLSEDLIRFGTLSAELCDFLDKCIKGRLSVVISGGTGSGKTTTLNVLSGFIPDNERILTVEDVAELRLNQRHVVSLEARPANIENQGEVTIRDLVRNALRMRPDRIVVGEIRDGAALDMLQAMNTGHDGSITTLHSNSPRDTLSRLETMVMMAGMDLPVRVIREQIASAVDLIVHQSRLRDGTRRITHVSEVLRMEGDVITIQDLFAFDFSAGVDSEGKFRGRVRPTGIIPGFLPKLSETGIEVPYELFQSEAR
jgi:pilus assembly protein CpaF